jgi:hypothetical protein
MKNTIGLILFLLLVTVSGSITSCNKKKQASNGHLEFSVDTLVFDTVFTTVGSTTQHFKIYNRDNHGISIEEIELMGGENSFFRINLDGLQGTKFSNIELDSKDSLFCFAEVTLGINGQNLPMVIEDSIRFRTNGIDQFVKLVVWGQDVYYHYSNVKEGIFDLNEGTWAVDKPHLIYGAAFVDSAKTLTIPAGAMIYMHNKSILWNYKGTLNIDGDYTNKVTIQGDRLESFYEDVSGQYYGIYFQEARPSTIDNLVLKNATVGIHMDSKDPNFTAATVTLTNTEIKNAASYGTLLYNGTKLIAENTLIHHAGVHALLVLQGADFTFTHCNLLNYGAGDYTYPAVGIRNYFLDSQGTLNIASIPNGIFRNCVIYGNGDEQLVLDTVQPSAGAVTLSFLFDHTVIRGTSSNHPMFVSSFFNSNPFFINPSDNNFKFSNLTSSLHNAGSASLLLPTDIENHVRTAPSDIGVYEID